MTDDDLGRDLAAFRDEHRECGTVTTGFTGELERVWLSCSCGARIERPAASASRYCCTRNAQSTTNAKTLLTQLRRWRAHSTDDVVVASN